MIRLKIILILFLLLGASYPCNKITILNNDNKLLNHTINEIITELINIDNPNVTPEQLNSFLTFKEKLITQFETLQTEINKGYNVKFMCNLKKDQSPDDSDNRCWQENTHQSYPNPAYVLAKYRNLRLVFLCPAYFQDEQKDRINTLIHELSHLFLYAGHDHWQTAEYNPEILLTSAYFLGQFSKEGETVKETTRKQMNWVLELIVNQ